MSMCQKSHLYTVIYIYRSAIRSVFFGPTVEISVRNSGHVPVGVSIGNSISLFLVLTSAFPSVVQSVNYFIHPPISRLVFLTFPSVNRSAFYEVGIFRSYCRYFRRYNMVDIFIGNFQSYRQYCLRYPRQYVFSLSVLPSICQHSLRLFVR